ncbi:bifunctional biotin--[acetyl-CoA-carboxylase] synthetase/biotin operon repressor [Cystobacter fuscus]|uniref:Bifunctional ligase/repressor BirA n=1 Tax=Cystobacter fuscus TaxID=43 RepID=A0A250J371_9BACT|nr:biotin--[acetyl-CoA-carboxylase] ligase [Cystobacter fuscus]ATB38404.1 bifunctional biotin--[acetyl-CoA-carboxylase] synthetase/biotin operon repressor [Cystobacter fuscus]
MGVESAEQTYEEIILGFLVEGRDGFCSGEALSDKLGLSRTAVWKHVESLRGKGYRIDAVPARGYRLVDVPDKLTPLELAPLLSTHHLGQQIHFHESLPSTNVTAFQLAADGAEHGEVVITEQQTAGKGRRGRVWTSPPGVNLYFSAILRPELPPQRASELTLVAAVALAETLREQDADARIKWPNDVQLDGRKVAGILTELSADPDQVHFVVLGVGVNLNSGPEDFPPELAETATSLSRVLGRRVNRALFTSSLWGRLEEWLDLHHEVGFEPVRQRWVELSSTLHQEVRVRTDRAELRGVAEDIDAAGALLVRTPEGRLERVLAGDVEQVRPR